MRTIVLVIVAALVAFAAVGCASGSTTVTEVDDGETVRLKVGDTLTVELPGNPSTGYSWNGDADPEILVMTGEPGFRADSDLVGAGGIVTLEFEAVEVGESLLELGYARAWESVEPLDTFSLDVVVE